VAKRLVARSAMATSLLSRVAQPPERTTLASLSRQREKLTKEA
jgi:hypothetical protein